MPALQNVSEFLLEIVCAMPRKAMLDHPLNSVSFVFLIEKAKRRKLLNLCDSF